MKLSTSIFVALTVVTSTMALAQEQNPWGKPFSCSVDWFSECRLKATEIPGDPRAIKLRRSEPEPPRQHTLPAPVRNVLENPSLETARAYVMYSKEAQEKLAKATVYIAEAMREMRASGSTGSDVDRNISGSPGLGPVGLYYFFSPSDRTARSDVAVLNKIFLEGRLGVVGIPVGGRDHEIAAFVGQTKPLFPVRRSDTEVRLVNPAETPELHLALPMQKKIVRLGAFIDEKAIQQAIGIALAAQIQ